MSTAPAQLKPLQLPPNSQWDHRTAPAERFEALEEKVGEIKRDTLQKMEKTGKISPEVVQSVRDNFGALCQSLEESRPEYPSPVSSISRLYEQVSKSGFSLYSYDVYFCAGQGAGDEGKLVRYYNHHAGNSDPSKYATDDRVNKKVSDLIKGFEKIRKLVVRSLQKPGPASKQKIGFPWRKRPASQVVEELFSQQQSNLAFLAAKAKVAKQEGVFVAPHYWFAHKDKA